MATSPIGGAEMPKKPETQEQMLARVIAETEAVFAERKEEMDLYFRNLIRSLLAERKRRRRSIST
jgi:hypothetical protein